MGPPCKLARLHARTPVRCGWFYLITSILSYTFPAWRYRRPQLSYYKDDTMQDLRGGALLLPLAAAMCVAEVYRQPLFLYPCVARTEWLT